MALTTRQVEVLQAMAKAHAEERWDETEIVSEGIVCYLGNDRISWKTLNAFIDHVLVSLEGNGSFRRWTINGTGLLVAKFPAIADKIWLTLRSGKPFTTDDEGNVIEI